MSKAENIELLKRYKDHVEHYLFTGFSPCKNDILGDGKALYAMKKEAAENSEYRRLRSEINMMKGKVHHILAMVGVGNVLTMQVPGRPPLQYDLLDLVTDNQTFKNIEVSMFTDRIEQAIGIFMAMPDEREKPLMSKAEVDIEVMEGFVFIAMAIDDEDPELTDVHNAIKDVAKSMGLSAARVDEYQTNNKITDTIIDSLRKAEYVVADLTHARPNVFWEAGFAHALDKTPIYIAKAGTKLEFDVKDYPVIFFNNMTSLKEGLAARFEGLQSGK